MDWKKNLPNNGVNSLNQTTYSVMGDRIETGTFCVAATLAKGNLIIKKF